MKIAALISRILLGLAFLVFGLNGFLDFIPHGPMPTGPAGQFVGVLMGTHYFNFVAGVMIVSGTLFLVGRYIALAVILIAPVIVNILLFHLCMDPKGIVPGAVLAVLWFIVALSVRSAFAGIFRKNA